MHQYFYRKDDQQFGPFNLEQLKEESLTPETYIWYYGLERWVLLKEEEELMNALFYPTESKDVDNFRQVPTSVPPKLNKNKTTINRPPLPKNWMLENILITILCCVFPIGIVGIIYSSKVGNLYFQGQYDLAIERAKKAEHWFYYAIIANIILVFVLFIRGFIKL